jgi:hypothetical protein
MHALPPAASEATCWYPPEKLVHLLVSAPYQHSRYPVDIPVGGAVSIPVEISIPLAPLEAAGCALPNTAAIVAPAAGAADNYDDADDSSTATADAFLQWVDGFGVTHVTCDPSNLKTTKTSKGDCVPAGTGFRCEFVATVENMGPDTIRNRRRSLSPGAASAAGRAISASTGTSISTRSKASISP